LKELSAKTTVLDTENIDIGPTIKTAKVIRNCTVKKMHKKSLSSRLKQFMKR